MNPTDYVTTTAISDEQGKAILATLWDLYGNTYCHPETNKKVRRGSWEERAAGAALKAEIIKAAAHFERARQFHDWLTANTYDTISPYDPIATEIEISNKLRDFEWRMRRVEENYKSDAETLRLMLQDIISRLPPEMERKTDKLILDIVADQAARR